MKKAVLLFVLRPSNLHFRPNADSYTQIDQVLGHKFQNNQLLFAANGYFVFTPDMFRGDPIPFGCGDEFDVETWHRLHGVDNVDWIVEASITELREKYNIEV